MIHLWKWESRIKLGQRITLVRLSACSLHMWQESVQSVWQLKWQSKSCLSARILMRHKQEWCHCMYNDVSVQIKSKASLVFLWVERRIDSGRVETAHCSKLVVQWGHRSWRVAKQNFEEVHELLKQTKHNVFKTLTKLMFSVCFFCLFSNSDTVSCQFDHYGLC